MLPEIMRDDVFRLETQRLWLRWPRPRDAVAITAMVSEAEVAMMTSHIPHPYPEGEALRHIMRVRADNEAGCGASYVVTQQGRWNSPIGMIGVRKEGADIPTIGFFIGRAFWGNGFATEALQALMTAIFRLTSLPSISAGAMSCNPASRRVQEKCGFVYTGSAVEHIQARAAVVAVDHLVLTRQRWAGLPRLFERGAAVESFPAIDAACL